MNPFLSRKRDGKERKSTIAVSENQPDQLLPERDRHNRLAALAFYCGIIGVCCLPLLYSPLVVIIPVGSFLGFLAGITALIQIYRSGSRFTGARQAWLGLLLCPIAFGVSGYFYAGLANSMQSLCSRRTMRGIGERLNMYAHDHNGYYPTSLDALDLPPGDRYCRKYTFLFLHTKRPYLLNGYLAGVNINRIADPDKTVIVAIGRGNGKKLFYGLQDIDFNIDFSVRANIAFINGYDGLLLQRDIPSRFPRDGKVTDDTWFIKPRFR